MNSKLAHKAWLAGRFIDFILHSGNRYHLHSPFLYSLAEEVIRGNKSTDGGKNIEMLRRECLESKEIIMKTDYGEGAKSIGGVIYPVELRRIAMTSLTPKRQARRLARLVQFIKAGRILEIGTSLGMTTAYLAMANPESRVITLEGCPELCRKAGGHFAKLGLKNIGLIEGRFEDTLPRALMQLGSIDMVFIDGNHQKEAVLDYFEKCLAYAHNDTVIVFDDIHASKGMKEAWELVKQRQEVRISLDFFYTGWVFFRKESSRQHFRLRYI